MAELEWRLDNGEEVEVAEVIDENNFPPFWNYTRIETGLLEESDAEGRLHLSEGEEGDCFDGMQHPRFDITYVLAAGGAVAILVTIWVIYRFYRLMLLMYCRNLTRQCLELVPPCRCHTSTAASSESGHRQRSSGNNVAHLVHGTPTIYVIRETTTTSTATSGCAGGEPTMSSSSGRRSGRRGRAERRQRNGSGVSGVAAVLARMQGSRKGDSPPPPYDSPPPYHIAIKMGSVPDVIVSEPVII